jgi:hypothetical protein
MIDDRVVSGMKRLSGDESTLKSPERRVQKKRDTFNSCAGVIRGFRSNGLSNLGDFITIPSKPHHRRSFCLPLWIRAGTKDPMIIHHNRIHPEIRCQLESSKQLTRKNQCLPLYSAAMADQIVNRTNVLLKFLDSDIFADQDSATETDQIGTTLPNRDHPRRRR